MRTLWFLPWVVVLLASTTRAQTAQIEWLGDYDVAFKQAQAEKRPVFIVILMDAESANDEVARSHLHNAEIVSLSRSFECLIACTGAHPAQDEHGTSVCSKFGRVGCGLHQAVEMRVRKEFMDSPRVAAPQFLMVAPDGKTMLVRHVYTLAASELAKKMKIALGIIDPSKGGDELSVMKAATDDLLKQANDNNAQTRQDAIRALATSEDPRVIDFLIKQTAENVDDSKRLEAIEAMGQRGNGKVLPVLHKLLDSRSFMIRSAVAKSLASLGMPDSGPALFTAARKEDKSMVRGPLAKALIICDPVAPEHRKLLIGMIKSSAQSDRLYGLRISAYLTLDEDLRKALCAAVQDGNPAVRGVAYWTCGCLKVAAAADPISKGLSSEKNRDVKVLGASALARIKDAGYEGPDPESALDNLFSTAGLVY